jgi:hypothetical protein
MGSTGVTTQRWSAAAEDSTPAGYGRGKGPLLDLGRPSEDTRIDLDALAKPYLGPLLVDLLSHALA